MDGRETGRRWHGLFLSLVLAAGLAGCSRKGPDGPSTSTPKQVLATAGQRLGRSLSAGELTKIARREERVLANLTAAERDALSRGYLGIEVDRPSIVFVAALPDHEPFWLAGRGFGPVPERLEVVGSSWRLFRKPVDPGRVELGVNALDLAAPAHYAVFVQDVSGGPAAVRVVEGDGWKVVAAVDGTSLASGVALPIVALPALLRGATLLQPVHDLRHSTPLARGRVWKTHVTAGGRPDQVVVSFGADGSRELVWTWRTGLREGRSVVRYHALVPGRSDPRPRPGDHVAEVVGQARRVDVPELLNDPSELRHLARTGGLGPDTTYAYSVGDGTAEGMSPWYTVRTGPGRSADTHLLYMGDPQCGLEGWGRLLASAYRRHPEASVLLIAGDLVDRGNERSNWDHFFLRAAGVFERLAIMPAVGNHEYLDRGPRLYRAFFELPTNGPEGLEPGLAYSFTLGDAFVAVLDSTRADSGPIEAARQARWLDEQLDRHDRRWSIVVFHHPLYASHPTRENLSLRDAWVPVIDRHRVDLVLQGHDHAYLRTYPMRANRRMDSPAKGTVYVVSVSGEKYCDLDPRDYGEVGFSHVSTYQTIDLTGGGTHLAYRAWDGSGKVVDSFQIEKPRPSADLAGR